MGKEREQALNEFVMNSVLQVADLGGRMLDFVSWDDQYGTIILDPSLFSGDNWALWQLGLKAAAWINQGYKCICGSSAIAGDLHHAIVTRAEVQRNPKGYLIHHTYNVIYVHPQCHGSLRRSKCWKFLEGLYGEKVELWHAALLENLQELT